jgi:hypothetical protein
MATKRVSERQWRGWGWSLDGDGWMAQVYDDHPRVWRVFHNCGGLVAEGPTNRDAELAKHRAQTVMTALAEVAE